MAAKKEKFVDILKDSFADGKKSKPKPPTIGARLRGYLLGGILVTTPLAITIYIALLFIQWGDNQVRSLIPTEYYPEFSIPGLGLILIIAGLIFIGWITASLLGRFFIRLTHYILARVPVVRNVYLVSKQVMETVVSNRSDSFREVVLIQYPRKGIWGIAFVTGHTKGEVQDITTDEVVNVFVPTTPNPTSGFLLFVPRRDLVPLSMTIEEGVKMVISGGIVTPDDRRVGHLRKSNIIPSGAITKDVKISAKPKSKTRKTATKKSAMKKAAAGKKPAARKTSAAQKSTKRKSARS